MAPRPIFIHGAGGGAGSWEHQEPKFEGCYVVSLPGHPVGTALASVGAYAEWTAQAIAEIPGPRVLVGHGMGGAIALQLAVDQPELVAGIVVAGGAARPAVPDAAFELARSDFPAGCERLLRTGWPEADDATTAAEVGAMVENGQETLLQDYAAWRDHDLRDRLPEIGVPVLVVTGGSDAIATPALAEELAGALRQPLAVILPGVGHWPMKEQPSAVDLLVAGFLARLELSGD